MLKQPGVLIVLTGPSGVGKGVLRSEIAKDIPSLKASISITTRERRPTETDGVDYFFVTPERFREMIDRNELVEWAEYAGHYYGTPKHYFEDTLQSGCSILLEIEVQGALNIRNIFPAANLIFIEPPSMAILEDRLRTRNTNSEADIQRRLKTAAWELAQKTRFDHILLNDDLAKCKQELLTLVESLLPQKADPSCSAPS